MADYAESCRIHRWNYEGQYLGVMTSYCGDPPGNFRSVGFGVLDGDIVVGRYNVSASLYDLDGNPRLRVNNQNLRGLVPGPDEDLLVLTQGGNSFVSTFTRRGQERGAEVIDLRDRVFVTRFMDGYLNTNDHVGLVQRRRDASIVEHPDQRWDRNSPFWLSNRGGLAWLDDDTLIPMLEPD